MNRGTNMTTVAPPSSTVPSEDTPKTLDTFEWLTSYHALEPLLRRSVHGIVDSSDALPETADLRHLRAINVGCGTSMASYGLMYGTVGVGYCLNLDSDFDIISKMSRVQQRHRARHGWGREDDPETSATLCSCACKLHSDECLFSDMHQNRLHEWKVLDFGNLEDCSRILRHEPEFVPFDLVFDKSTLDCFICSDSFSASNLIVESYLSLKPGGVYFIVSFNEPDLIIPMVRDCPGLEWEAGYGGSRVDHHVIRRHADDPRNACMWDVCSLARNSSSYDCTRDTGEGSSTEKSKSLFVNVYIFRKQIGGSTEEVGKCSHEYRSSVREHIRSVNDIWFTKMNPMLTSARENRLRQAFAEGIANHIDASILNDPGIEMPQSGYHVPRDCLPLRDCYDVLFTDTEREHLDFSFFLEDWKIFQEGRDQLGESLSQDGMNLDTALQFLHEMQ